MIVCVLPSSLPPKSCAEAAWLKPDDVAVAAARTRRQWAVPPYLTPVNDGWYRCTLCGALADYNHVTSLKHVKNRDNYYNPHCQTLLVGPPMPTSQTLHVGPPTPTSATGARPPHEVFPSQMKDHMISLKDQMASLEDQVESMQGQIMDQTKSMEGQVKSMESQMTDWMKSMEDQMQSMHQMMDRMVDRMMDHMRSLEGHLKSIEDHIKSMGHRPRAP